MNKFPCTSCGACCRRLNIVPKEILRKNGLKADSTGRCQHLLKDNKCRIYKNRPQMCVVDHRKTNTNPDVYYKTVADTCNQWMDEDKSPYKRVKL